MELEVSGAKIFELLISNTHNKIIKKRSNYIYKRWSFI